ncbi:hypothetical protein Echvi_0796 [Echinicola vietnamensis DSM 17526]|uniref:Uncharacterized protein n=1 Tax=Echinicola vietnamensis (strain DSM 17526 / LMG 23754 / KMM 6221) TaxID=926556 RepID=L0FWF4_ECHVK|nr:hypothetical protein Echvi_0796 [Echinicola vietnamensis DSM 17526]
MSRPSPANVGKGLEYQMIPLKQNMISAAAELTAQDISVNLLGYCSYPLAP